MLVVVVVVVQLKPAPKGVRYGVSLDFNYGSSEHEHSTYFKLLSRLNKLQISVFVAKFE